MLALSSLRLQCILSNAFQVKGFLKLIYKYFWSRQNCVRRWLNRIITSEVITMTRQELIEYCQNEYNALVDRPFKHYPDYVAIRHQSGKWFGLVMNVPASKLGLSGADEIDIVDLKVEPELNSLLQVQPGFFPGYHMAKAHWISARLDHFGSVTELADLIAGSYNATK